MDPRRHTPEATPTDTEAALDPRGAAALLDQVDRDTRQRLSGKPPLLAVLQAAVVLVVYGALWFSVRGQHPYRGPSVNVVGVVYIIVAVGALIGGSVYYRGVRGVSGGSRRQDALVTVAFVAGLGGFYTFLGGLRHDGFDNAVVWGVVDAAGPWLILGALLAGVAAAREDRWMLAGGIALVVGGTAASFAGPNDVWGVLAIEGCVLLLAQGALRLAWAHRP
jgi:hypothetical protein